MSPKVSIVMVTYNHEFFIAQAIESVMMQQTDFAYELVIGEDKSTDNTLSICREYKHKYPDKIKLLERDVNLGMTSNFIDTLNNCTGEYIAILDGDDYLTDPLKLQKQVDLLESRQDCIAVFHNVAVLDHQGINRNVYNYENGRVLNFEDLATGGHHIKVCAILFRNIIDNVSLKYIKDDDTLGFYLLSGGKKAYYVNETMAVYRIHSGGVWSKIDQKKRFLFAEPLELKTKDQYNKQYPEVMSKRLFNFYKNSSYVLMSSREYKTAFYALRQMMKNGNAEEKFDLLQWCNIAKRFAVSLLKKSA